MRPVAFTCALLTALATTAWATEKTIYSSPDPLGAVTITENQAEARRTVTVGGHPVAWTGDGADRRALTPYMLLAKPPLSVARLGMTNGVAVGAAARMGAMKITVVEPNRALMKGLILHAPALSTNGVEGVAQDLSAWLDTNTERFDFISVEARALAGVKRPFERVAKRMAPHGSVALSAPLGSFDGPTFTRLVGAFAKTFPHVTLWFDNLIPTRGYLLLLGSQEPQQFQPSSIRQRLGDLASGGYFLEADDAESFLTFYITDQRGVAAMKARGDEKKPFPLLLPYSPDGFGRSKSLFSLLVSYRSFVAPHVDADAKETSLLDRYFSCRTRMLQAAMIGTNGTAAEKLARLDEAATFGVADAHLALAYFRHGMGSFRSHLLEQAATTFEKAKAITPRLLQVRYALGLTYEKMVRHADAAVEFEAVEKLAPGYRHQIRIKPTPDASKEE